MHGNGTKLIFVLASRGSFYFLVLLLLELLMPGFVARWVNTNLLWLGALGLLASAVTLRGFCLREE